jgi:outer membrane protein
MIGLLMLNLIGSAFAETTDLQYADALQTALDRNPTLQGSAAQLDQASGALLVAEGVYDPFVTGRTTYSSMTSESIREFGEVLSEFAALDTAAGLSWQSSWGTSASVDLSTTRSRFKYELAGDIPFTIESDEPLYQTRLAATISQSLLEGHRRSYNLQAVRQAQQAVDISKLTQRVQRQQTLADTANAYWSLWTARELTVIADEGLALALEEKRLVHARVDLGELAPVERSRVDSLLVMAQTDLLEARHSEAAASDTLLLLIGLPIGTEVVLTSEPEEPQHHDLNISQLQEVAREASPSLALLRLEEEGARADVEAARHALLPDLGASTSYAVLGYETSQSASINEMVGASLPEWSVGLNLSIPVGNRAARGSLQSATAFYTQKRIDREALESSIDQQVAAQARAITSAQAKLELAETQLGLAEETLSAERALRDAGRSLEKDVLDALKSLSDARIAVEQAKVEYLLAIIELERVKGSL